MERILHVIDLTPAERSRMIKTHDIAERVINRWPIIDPATFEEYVYFGRDRLQFDSVIACMWPWIHWTEETIKIARDRYKHKPDLLEYAEWSYSIPKGRLYP